MKKILNSFFIILSILLLSGCGEEKPEVVAKNFIDSFSKGDNQKVLEYLEFDLSKEIYTKKFPQFDCELKADFKNKVKISLRETRESNYWLRVIKALDEKENEELDQLLAESLELKNIFGAIVNNTKL